MKALRVFIFVIVMGTVAGGLLVGVNALTASLIAKNEELKLKSNILDVFEFRHETSEVIKAFEEHVTVATKGPYTFYTTSDGRIAFEFSGIGLWGPISCIISLEKDLKTIARIKVTHQEETPGLGARIAEEAYLKQFKNKEVVPKLFFVPEGKAAQNNEVDAITGATGSSRAFEKLINENVQKYVAALKG